MNRTKEAVSTEKAPAAIGPYSQAVKSGHFLFVSGQIGLDPDTGVLVSGGIQAQTDRVLRNLKAILEAGGLGLADVVKTTCFLRDMADFPAFNKVYEIYFSSAPPARETVAVADLPKGALVEVSCIAVGSSCPQ
jgi:2-iminobutanoate/2-iminopropanoate deaminase|uniref:RidA family protein n=1 Tax=Desulfomonile tiedjei TaxID=2358 RepID=A0A7C4AQI2_9BACT